MKLNLRRSAILLIFLAAVAILGACSQTVARPTIGSATVTNPSSANVKPEDLSAVWETYRILKRDYVDQSKVDPVKFSNAAITGMTAGEHISVQPSNEAPSGVPRELLPIWDTFQKIVRTKGNISPESIQSLNELAINAVIDSLDDVQNVYINTA